MSDYIPGCDIVTNFSSLSEVFTFFFIDYVFLEHFSLASHWQLPQFTRSSTFSYNDVPRTHCNWVRYGTTCTTQHNTEQHNRTRYNTAQHNTKNSRHTTWHNIMVQNCTTSRGTTWQGKARHSIGQQVTVQRSTLHNDNTSNTIQYKTTY